MKRNWILLFIVIAVAAFAGCGRSGEDQLPEGRKSECEIAVLIDAASIKSDPFYYEIWRGAEEYSRKNGVSCQWYAVSAPQESYTEAMQEAAFNEAKVIVAAGSRFQEAASELERSFPDVSFILVDAPRQTAQTEIKDNVAGFAFAEEEAGYMAGYAAVTEGYRSLGFLGGGDPEAAKRFGYGFLCGADDAAVQMQLSDVTIRYQYREGFELPDKPLPVAQDWYAGGTEVIFACCKEANASIATAAEAAGKAVIGSETDQASLSSAVVVSATKSVAAAVEQALCDYYDGEFSGGSITLLDAACGGVGLSMRTSRLQNFSQEDYRALCESLAAKSEDKEGVLMPEVFSFSQTAAEEELLMEAVSVIFLE